MTRSDLEQLVVGFIRDNLSPTEGERSEISTRYLQLQDFLAGRTFQNGSYARFTSTTPVNDLDVIYVLPQEVVKSITVARAIDTSKLDIHRIIESLAGELRVHYGRSATIKLQPHSAGIYFGREDEFSIDVVPAVPTDDGMFWVPEIAHLSVAKRRGLYRTHAAHPPSPNWIKSDPKGYIAQAKDTDERSDGRFRKAAKAMKRWRWGCKAGDDSFRLKSFHLEQAVTGLFGATPATSCCDAIGRTLEGVPDLIARPQIPDRADRTRFIDEYVCTLTAEERKTIQTAHRLAMSHWASVLEAGTSTEARRALATFFCMNPVFPVRAVSGASASPVPRGLVATNGRDPGEQFLQDNGVSTDLRHGVRINARVTQNGFRPFNLRGSTKPLLKQRHLEFFIDSCDVPEPYDVRWKVKNTGPEAAARGDLRGQIYADAGRHRHTENTKYRGNHYVECYIIKDGVCVAADHIDVVIGRS